MRAFALSYPNPDPSGPRAETPRLEALRPLESQLTIRDYTLLEGHLLDVSSSTRAGDRLLARLIRTKLADAQVVLSDDIAPNVATGNSRIVYSIDGTEERTEVLRHWEHKADTQTVLPVRSLLGVTLLGMSAGQHLPLLLGDGGLGHVRLIGVEFQPEAARRLMPG